jgi:PAS domain S-box-containing protein
MKPELAKRRSHLNSVAALFVMGVSMVMLALLGQELNRLNNRDITATFIADTSRISTIINERMLAYSQVLRIGAAFFAGSASVERDEWHRFVEKLDLDQNFKGIQGVGFSLVIPKQKLSKHINAIRSQGFPDYIVKPEGDREIYTSIIYLEPFTGRNLRAFGYDMFSEATRNEAMTRAQDIGDLAFTGKVKLVQETKKDVQAGLLAYFPVYKNGVIAQTPEQRRAALVGWVYSPYRMKDLLDAIAGDSLVMTRLEVFDGENATGDNLLYDSHAEQSELAAVKLSAVSSIKKIEFGGRYWTLRYTALPGYEATLNRQPIWIELLGLATIGILLLVLTWLLINTRRNAEAIANDLTASIRKSEARYTALFSNSKAPMLLIDPKSGQILETNHTAARYYGYSEGQLETMNIADINTFSKQELAEEMALADQEKRSHFYFKHRLANGSIRDVEVHSGPIEVEGQHLLYSIVHDVTERKFLEQQLQTSEERFNFAIEGSGDGMWDWNIITGQVYFSKRWKEMLGFTGEEISGSLEEWTSRVHPDDMLKVMQDIQAYFDGHSAVYSNEHRMLCKNGSYKWILDRGIVATRDANGKPTRMIGTHTDMTERREAAETLKKAKEAAEAHAKSKSEFLANMSHEIRTPMNAIIGLSQLALNHPVSDDVRDYLEKINDSSQALLGIINDILDFSKIEAGKLKIDNQRFNLVKILSNLHNLFEHQVEAKSIHFDIEAAENVPVDLIGDRLRLQQILSNLLGNAIKFTERGRVTLKIKLLDAEESQAKLHFCVCDTGIGISLDEQAKLFEPFSQVDTSATRRFGGTGLGLAISRNLLNLMGSELHLDSTPGQGSSFAFELLFSVASKELHHELNRRYQERKAGSLTEDLRERGKVLSGARVLVAEDNRINQQVVKEFLKLSGVDVDIANNGKEALTLLEQNTYDAVLMDVHMPEMDGIEATERIRRQPKIKDLPIIALTAGVTKEEREGSLAAGMNDFIAKPITPEALIDVLTKWFVPVSEPITNHKSDNDSQPELPVTNDWPIIDGIDSERAAYVLGGDKELFDEILQMFVEDSPALLDQANAFFSEHQFMEAAKIIHKLKGQAANIGAMALTEACSILEVDALSEQTQEITLKRISFEMENKRLLTSISVYLLGLKISKENNEKSTGS